MPFQYILPRIFDIFLLVVLNLIKVVSARFPHYKVVDIFPFVINRCLEEILYKFSSNPSSPQTSAHYFSIHQWVLSTVVISEVVSLLLLPMHLLVGIL